jgi:hypothetical protein
MMSSSSAAGGFQPSDLPVTGSKVPENNFMALAANLKIIKGSL